MQLFGWLKTKEKKKNLPHTEVPIHRKLSYRVANLQGIGARSRQEDSFAFVNVLDVTEIQKNGLLFAVADGMGGMKDGKIASECAIASVRESFANIDRSGDIARQLVESVYEAGERVEALLDGYGGSTLIASVIYQEKLYFASVGDSYFYLYRHGQLYRLNREHNVKTEIFLESIRRGRMDPTEVENSKESAALTQFLGMCGMDDVDGFLQPLKLHNGDILLVCSDGVGGVVSEEVLLEAMHRATPQEICACIEQEILRQRRGNQDNYTALVVQCIY